MSAHVEFPYKIPHQSLPSTFVCNFPHINLSVYITVWDRRPVRRRGDAGLADRPQHHGDLRPDREGQQEDV